MTNVTRSRPLSPHLQIYKPIPTMIMFKQGQVVKKLIGAQPKARIEADLELPALA